MGIGQTGAMVDEACRRSLKMIQEIQNKENCLSGSIWPTPYRSDTQKIEITDDKIKNAVENQKIHVQKSLKTDQVVYCWQEASQVYLKKPQIVVTIPQFEILKKIKEKKQLDDKDKMIIMQLQRPGFPKSSGFLLDKNLK